MTEAEWLAATDPIDLLEWLRGRDRLRLFRLCACACLRRIWRLLPDNSCRRLVEVLESNTEGKTEQVDYTDISNAIYESIESQEGTEIEVVARQACITLDSDDWPTWASTEAGQVARWVQEMIYLEARAISPNWNEDDFPIPAEKQRWAESAVQAIIVRDIFGNPFRPVAVDPSWLTSTVVALAEGIYAEKAFDRMPILADALQDAGCEHADILTHCRGDGPHVRGCWVVDLLLGKS